MYPAFPYLDNLYLGTNLLLEALGFRKQDEEGGETN